MSGDREFTAQVILNRVFDATNNRLDVHAYPTDSAIVIEAVKNEIPAAEMNREEHPENPSEE